MMSNTAGPSTGGFSGKPANQSRNATNQKKFGTPLPILLPCSPLHPSYNPRQKQHQSTYLSSLIPSFSWITPQVIVPRCVGVFDPVTRSVKVENKQDMEILFRRGFFGKGSLSRSEPTWRDRRIDLVKGGESAAAEKIREKRRVERKQFKIDRAQAMLDAAKAAEAVITTGQTPNSIPSGGTVDGGSGAGLEGEVEDDGLASPAPTAASMVDVNALTPQTFLVRPTRPDSNRNRGRNAFKPKPPKPKPSVPDVPPNPGATPMAKPKAEDLLDEEEDEFGEDIVEEMEFLQLGLEEAWFLSTGLGVLQVFDPTTETFIPPSALISMFITPPTPTTSVSSTPRLLPDDPFLVSYVAYYHFRSLGWVVKPGIKFCCDWLLYRRGPVFSHAAFSIVMIPVYANEQDRETSPYRKEDWYDERLSWKWMNTVMRVNSLVQKTVALVYITIPSLDSFPTSSKRADGSLDPTKHDMASLLSRYAIREVILSRFGPARRRD